MAIKQPHAFTETQLRAALDAVLVIDPTWMQTTLAKFAELRFVPEDQTVRGASLSAPQRAGTGELWVHFSNAGRTLKITALYDDKLSTVTTYRLPREHRPKVMVASR